MTINEKLELIARANELREKYYQLLGHHNTILRLREQISKISSTANFMAFLYPLFTDVYPPSGGSVYTKQEALELGRRIIDLFDSFRREIESTIVGKLSKLNIQLEAEDENG
ncbi:hypothetical protein D9V84_10425 [Bacteroidetes/Chlorobi group bacterium Naka2016]|jgi:hypothetical protein|nr:MAG: hypothetical protein D9V84_10425 [Bacteroidetes/Chlorobi group bacterium Naka2016]